MPPAPGVSAPLQEPVDLVLHIGSGKTGTSSIQTFLFKNRARLAQLGLLYPQSPGRQRHIGLRLLIQPDAGVEDIPQRHRDRLGSPEEFRRTFFGEIEQAGLHRVLLSDESLYGSTDDELRRLSRFTQRIAGRLRIVVYLRRQDDHLASRYQQVVKAGETRRLAERTEQLDLSKTYDYYTRLRTWEQLLAPTEFVVRRFERSSFVDGSLYQDFLAAAGIDARAADLAQVQPRNESLDAEAVEFLRILNILRGQQPATGPSVPANHALIRRLAETGTGPTLTLPAPVLDAFMAQWEKSNQRVAVEILGDESGELFRMPRRTHNTTTEQRFDPARLDLFVALLDLPDELVSPLRAVVEREADH